MRFARGPAATRTLCLLLAFAGLAGATGSLWLDWARGTQELEQGISSGWNWMGTRSELLAVPHPSPRTSSHAGGIGIAVA